MLRRFILPGIGCLAIFVATGCEEDKPFGPDDYAFDCLEKESGGPPEAESAYRQLREAEKNNLTQSDVDKNPQISLARGCRSISVLGAPEFEIFARGSLVGKPGMCAPFTGQAFIIRVFNTRTPSVSAFEAFVSTESFRPREDVWRSKMSSRAAQVLGLSVIRGIFENGKLVEGPYSGGVSATYFGESKVSPCN